MVDIEPVLQHLGNRQAQGLGLAQGLLGQFNMGLEMQVMIRDLPQMRVVDARHPIHCSDRLPHLGQIHAARSGQHDRFNRLPQDVDGFLEHIKPDQNCQQRVDPTDPPKPDRQAAKDNPDT